ncbi:MAG: hypothetical protein V4850_14300 [Myxococcota bacterium]
MFVRLLPLLALVACGGTLSTSSSTCSYDDIDGICTFTNVTPDAQVTFDFWSNDLSVNDTGSVLIGDEGTAPDQACIDELGIELDDTVYCSRSVLTESGGDGDCAPVEWEFDDFETRDCEH